MIRLDTVILAQDKRGIQLVSDARSVCHGDSYVEKQRQYMKLKQARTPLLDERTELGERHHMRARLKVAEQLGYLEGEMLADIGCGSGRYLLHFKQSTKTDSCVGLDFSKQSLLVAREALKTHGVHAALVLGDAENLPFSSSSFDVAFSADLLEHLPAPSKGVSEIVRVSKDKIVICTPNRLCPLDMSRFAKIFGSHTPPPIEKYPTRFQLARMLRNSGLGKSQISVSESSFLPLGWILVNRRLPVSMRLIHLLLLAERFLETTPIVKHFAGVLAANCRKT
jgi:ubiquinone/menaquinone biosynthesis C-methylase UbiE